MGAQGLWSSTVMCVSIWSFIKRCGVGFIVCKVQMNTCLRGHPIWSSFGIEHLAYRSGIVRQRKRKISLHKPTVLCISYGWMYWSFWEREERAPAVWCAKAVGERRERERLWVVCSGNLWSPFTEYHIDKVPMDVVVFLVVNHVKYWCIVFGYAYVYGKVTDLENT